MKTVESAVLRQDSDTLSIEQLQLEDPRADEVLVKIVATGICHTDMVLRDAGIATRPVVLGHEGAGIVEQVGPGVTDFQPGDRVALSFASCGQCPSCDQHTPSYCEQFFPLNFMVDRADGSSSLSKDGETVHSHIFGQSSFSTHAVCNVSNLVKVSDSVPLELVGPFGCGFQTGAGAVLNALKVTPGSTVMVLGAGAVGLAAVMAAAYIAEAATVIAVDLHDSRLETALSVGATQVLNGGRDDFIEAVMGTCPKGVDYIIDTTGYLPLVESCVALLASQGTLGLVASYAPGASLNVDVLGIFLGGKKIQGIMEGNSDVQTFIPALLEHYQQGRFPVDKLVRYYDWQDINTAIADSETGETIKAIVKMPS